jgi:hypothetical protein
MICHQQQNPGGGGVEETHTGRQPANRSRTLEGASCDASGCFGLLAVKAFLASIIHALTCFRMDTASLRFSSFSFNTLFFREYA